MALGARRLWPKPQLKARSYPPRHSPSRPPPPARPVISSAQEAIRREERVRHFPVALAEETGRRGEAVRIDIVIALNAKHEGLAGEGCWSPEVEWERRAKWKRN